MLKYFKRERMAICVNTVRNFFGKYFKQNEIEEERASKIEAYLSILYKLLIWENTFLSGLALFGIHILFWIVVHFELRLYAICFLLLLIVFVFDASFEHIVTQTDKTIPLRTIRETVNFFSTFLQFLTGLRRENPGTFCVCMCTGFLLLSIIGRTFSGLLLTYLALLSFLLVPGILNRLPPEIIDPIRHALHVISTNEGVVAENELFPAHDEQEERDADCDSIKTDHTADSYTNSFISGVTSMPSYLDAEGSLDGLEEEDLEFTTRNIPNSTPSNISSDSSDNEHKDIKFESSHFNRDSSSDEENNYEKGLTFSEIDNIEKEKAQKEISFAQQISADLLSNLGSMGSSLVSSLVMTTTKSSIARRSDSDSDFEIIESDDVDREET